jgi:hypothetical protein
MIKEIDELIIEDEIIENPMTRSIAIAATEERSFRHTSTNIYKRFKHVLLSSSKSKSLNIDGRRSSKSTAILVEVANRKKGVRTSVSTWRNSSTILSSSMNASGDQRNVRRLRRDKRAATSLFTLVLIFMIFLLPYVLVVVAGRIFTIDILTNPDSRIYSGAFWLLWLNSTINPILYPFIQPKFRDAYRKIFVRFTRRRRRLLSLMLDMQRSK